jgi:hypothetical protein
MRVVTDCELARTLAGRREPVLYSHFPENMHATTVRAVANT